MPRAPTMPAATPPVSMPTRGSASPRISPAATPPNQPPVPPRAATTLTQRFLANCPQETLLCHAALQRSGMEATTAMAAAVTKVLRMDRDTTLAGARARTAATCSPSMPVAARIALLQVFVFDRALAPSLAIRNLPPESPPRTWDSAILAAALVSSSVRIS